MLPARSLTYFLATLESGSFTATARAFGVSVPTVSAGMAQLDDMLGHRLFLRTPRRLLPSEAAAGVELSRGRSLVGFWRSWGPHKPRFLYGTCTPAMTSA